MPVEKNGGGVLIYVKTGIDATKVSKIDVEPYDSIYVEIKKNNRKYILGVVYRPPKLSEENDMALYNEIKSVIKDKNTVICGDFNNPSVNWSTLTGNREGQRLTRTASGDLTLCDFASAGHIMHFLFLAKPVLNDVKQLEMTVIPPRIDWKWYYRVRHILC